MKRSTASKEAASPLIKAADLAGKLTSPVDDGNVKPKAAVPGQAPSAPKKTGKTVHALSPPKKLPGAPLNAAAAKADMPVKDPDNPTKGNGATSESALFNKHYNKELKLCEDEIPMVLCELNESALAYVSRE